MLENHKERFKTSSEWDQLALEIGKFVRYWGFKVIHGRIWTHIYLSDHPLDAGMLMKRFGLSKALMSLSLNDLLRYNVILEGPKSKRGTQTYVANPAVLDVIFNVLKVREKEMLETIKKRQEQLSFAVKNPNSPSQVDDDRLASLERMIKQAQVTLDTILNLSTLNLSDWEFMNETSQPSSFD